MTAVLPHTIALNPSHGVRSTDGQILATRIPAGCWMVKVRQRGDGWAAFAVLCDGAVDDQFDIATGVDREAVWLTAMRWVESATTAVMRFDRFVFVGFGDSFSETEPADVPADDAARDTDRTPTAAPQCRRRPAYRPTRLPPERTKENTPWH